MARVLRCFGQLSENCSLITVLVLPRVASLFASDRKLDRNLSLPFFVQSSTTITDYIC